MKKVLFLTLRWEDFGGYHSYIRHLYKGFNLTKTDWLAVIGYCNLSGNPIKLKCEDNISMVPIGVGDRNIENSRKFLKQFDIIHLFHLPYQMDKNGLLILKFYRLLNFDGKLFITIHDPAEDKNKKFAMKYLKNRGNVSFFYVGEMVKNYFEKKYNFQGWAIKHPYFPEEKLNIKKENLAINTSRIDFDKFTHLILDAIPNIKGRVHFYSGYQNPIYYWHYCKGKLESYWTQGFEQRDISQIYSPAKVLIDMSKNQGDGNRTQYPLLEAINFEVVPILRKGWFSDNSEFRVEENFLEAETPEEIAEQTNRVFEDESLYVKITENNKKILTEYDAGKIAGQYIEIYEKAAKSP